MGDRSQLQSKFISKTIGRVNLSASAKSHKLAQVFPSSESDTERESESAAMPQCSDFSKPEA